MSSFGQHVQRMAEKSVRAAADQRTGALQQRSELSLVCPFVNDPTEPVRHTALCLEESLEQEVGRVLRPNPQVRLACSLTEPGRPVTTARPYLSWVCRRRSPLAQHVEISSLEGELGASS
jgi:hypothetical protein